METITVFVLNYEGSCHKVIMNVKEGENYGPQVESVIDDLFNGNDTDWMICGQDAQVIEHDLTEQD